MKTYENMIFENLLTTANMTPKIMQLDGYPRGKVQGFYRLTRAKRSRSLG